MKKLDIFAIFPVYGSCIVIFALLIKALKKEINNKRLHLCLFSVGFVGFFSILSMVLFLKFVKTVIPSSFLENYGLYIAFILGGYLMNIYTFTMKDKWMANTIKNDKQEN